jgi:hypothetical protein
MAVFKNAVFYPETANFIQSAGITDETQMKAIGRLVGDLKFFNIWDKMKAIYPFVGQAGISSSFQFNLKDPTAFKGVFSGSWTFASTGVRPDGSTGYMNTAFNPSTQLSFTDSHISIYKNLGTISVSDRANGVYDIGGNAVDFSINPDRSTTLYSQAALGSYAGVGSNAGVQGNGFYVVARNANNFLRLTKNDTDTVTSTATSSPAFFPNDTMWVGASHQVGLTTITSPNDYRYAFVSIGNYLDSNQVSNFYTAVQRFQTTLGRQV